MMKQTRNYEILLLVVVVEIIVIIISFVLAYFTKVNLISLLNISLKATITGLIFLVVLTVVNLLSVFILPRYIGFLRPLKEAYDEVSGLVISLDPFSIVVISLFSGVAEELLFRGVVQTTWGIVLASLVFGLFHIGNKKTIQYGAYAILIGFYLGYLMIYTQSLWAPILVHVLNNAIAIPVMQWSYKKLKAQAPVEPVENNEPED